MFLFVVLVWAVLLSHNRGGDLGADINLGSILPTSALYHQVRGQKEGQRSQQCVIILNARWREEEERKKGNVLRPVAIF